MNQTWRAVEAVEAAAQFRRDAVTPSSPSPSGLSSRAALSVGRGDVAGVWRLSSGPSPVPPPVREGRHRLGGLWDYDVGRKEVILVPDRPADADARNVHEVVLRGAVGWGGAAPGDAVLPLPAVEGGSVAIGRCFYPRSHPSFFDGTGPVVRATNVGTFSMAQVLGSMNTGLPSDGDGDEYDGGGSGDGGTTGDEPPGGPAHAAEDLVGRRFLMTVEPLSIRDEKDPAMPLDLRVLPVEFHQNRTFTARGVNTILRGRYRVDRGSRLEMKVSLFGAGRSASGSVYRVGACPTRTSGATRDGSVRTRTAPPARDRRADYLRAGQRGVRDGPRDRCAAGAGGCILHNGNERDTRAFT
ncbi:hypothetical protein THAOC_19523 [Thalassiosira oceanica]|uniref:Uncharacterized protein n=1 Tax=Thalassiosira oceanica TaxID=159749 RepID=K0S2A8_THAOC|nr:hypothetical protein THAOC_19523 [Thalassiosira oceanica]|eukprot:EJK60173.1 hypothetical protein THAOC_19523 [Thalassiosira oceanica]